MELATDFSFRRSIYNILYQLRSSMGNEKFQELNEFLEERLEKVPDNNLEESVKFFYEVMNYLLQGLNEQYEITHETIENELFHSDTFTLKPSEEYEAMHEMYKKYRAMGRFRDSFLQEYNRDFWLRFRSRSYSRNTLELAHLNELGHQVLSINKIPLNTELYLPQNRHGSYIGGDWDQSYFSNVYNTVNYEVENITSMTNDYELLQTAVQEFDRQIEASLREEHMRFGIIHLKEILSKLIIPVSLIEDQQLRRLCRQSGREIFVKSPTLEDLMFKGSSVRVYSSHNMDDDSSYIAKPIILSETLPVDTDELKFLGVGQYTMHDPESPRSLNGANPYVINNNMYVKANLEDFMALLPDEILEEIRICENLVESMDNPLESIEIEENETLSEIIETIKEDKGIDPKEVVDTFMAASQYFKEEEERETGPIFIEEERYKFELVRFTYNHELLTFNSTHPEGYVVFRDNHGNVAGVRKNETDSTMHLGTTEDECLRALQLAPGLYTIYDFSKKNSYKQEAIHKLHHFAG